MKLKLRLMMALAATLATAVGCSNKQGQTESPVSITVDLPDQSGLTVIVPARTLTIPTMTLNSRLKDPTSLDPNHFADVELGTYTVTYRRSDGGTIVPPVQTFAAGALLPTDGTVTLTDFPVLSQAAMAGAPFDQLLPFNGGIDRETGSQDIRMFYDITFFGSTVSGKRVQSETVTAIRIFVAQ
jgi:hypothetical protein